MRKLRHYSLCDLSIPDAGIASLQVVTVGMKILESLSPVNKNLALTDIKTVRYLQLI